jgi:hypothetical protein
MSSRYSGPGLGAASGRRHDDEVERRVDEDELPAEPEAKPRVGVGRKGALDHEPSVPRHDEAGQVRHIARRVAVGRRQLGYVEAFVGRLGDDPAALVLDRRRLTVAAAGERDGEAGG